MKSLDSMSIEEISSEYGYISQLLDAIDILDIPHDKTMFVRDRLQEYSDLYGKAYLAKTPQERIDITQKMKTLLKSVEGYIDKKKYVYSTYRAVVEQNVKADNADKRLQKILTDAPKYLRGVSILSPQDIVFKENTNKVSVKTSEDFIGSSEKRIRREVDTIGRFTDISSRIEVDDLIGKVWPSDLIYICRYPELGNILANRLIESYSSEEHPNAELTEGKYYSVGDTTDAIHQNIAHMDLDRLFMLAIARCYKEMQKNVADVDQESLDKFIHMLQDLKNFIPRAKQKYGNSNEEITLDAVLEFSENLSQQFINGDYTSPEKIQEIRENILNGKMGFGEISAKDYLRTMHYTKEELLAIACFDMKAIEFYAQNHILSREEIEKLQSPETLISLYMEKDDSPENQKQFEIFRRIILFRINYL